MKNTFLLSISILVTIQVSAQSTLRKKIALDFYRDLVVHKVNEDSIIDKYLYLQPIESKNGQERNAYVKTILKEIRASGQSTDTSNIKVKAYHEIQPIANLKLDQERRKDIFALVKDDIVLSYILFKDNRILCCPQERRFHEIFFALLSMIQRFIPYFFILIHEPQS